MLRACAATAVLFAEVCHVNHNDRFEDAIANEVVKCDRELLHQQYAPSSLEKPHSRVFRDDCGSCVARELGT